jgi:hypothetical protein
MPSTATAAQCGFYLYAVTPAGEAGAGCGAGVEGAEIESVEQDGLAAIVSRLGVRKLRPQRSNLSAHHRVLNELSRRQTVLPAAFGTIGTSEEEVRDMLARNREVLTDLLARLAGKVEMGLKVYWETENIFEYFVATHQELETLRNRLFRAGAHPSVEQKLDLGKLFESLIAESRARHTRRVTEALLGCSAEIIAVDPGEERMIMKLACLVERERRGEWEEGVHRAARLFDDHYRFDYSGPWPPYNFVHVDLRLT